MFDFGDFLTAGTKVEIKMPDGSTKEVVRVKDLSGWKLDVGFVSATLVIPIEIAFQESVALSDCKVMLSIRKDKGEKE